MEPGSYFAGYRIIRRLGVGGMGEVYLAQHPRLPRQDALKVLPPAFAADPEFRARFIREADIAARLWHPNIVAVHDRGEEEGRLWIAMDYVAGRDTGQLLAERYPAGMPYELVVPIVQAVAGALDYAHGSGLLHRDVKPANIILSDDGQRTLLTDFGIARPLGETTGGLTATGLTLGTVGYAAPEQLMGQHLDGRADQYALAATVYQLLTGLPMFRDSNQAVVISKHLNGNPPALAAQRPELADIDPVIAVALAKNPDDRFPTCTDFSRAFSARTTTQYPPSSLAPTRAASVGQPSPEPETTPGPVGWATDPTGGSDTLYWDGLRWHRNTAADILNPPERKTRFWRRRRGG